jgi:pimeloyl-ACP methyl ester carboxylesterase
MSDDRAAVSVIDGPANAATLVVVPPLGMPAALMATFTGQLAKRLRIVTVELPGAGHADRLHPTTTRAQAAILADAIRASCEGPAHLFGSSYGGMVAMWVAIDAPSLVSALILASTTARGRDAIVAEPGEKLALLARALGRGAMRVALAEAVLTEETRRSPTQTAQVERAIEASPRDDTELLWLAAAVAAHDASGELATIHAPTLVLTGADDDLVPARLQDELAAAIPNAKRATIDEAGHAPSIDRPEASASAVLAFLDSL